MMGLTSQQRDLLDFIKAKMAETRGIAPSIEEMRVHLKLRSRGTTHRLVLELEDRGHIIRRPNMHRGIELVQSPDPVDAARDALARVGAKPTVANINRIASALSEARNAA